MPPLASADRPGGRALARLLSPLAERDFFDTHWERAPVHVERADSRHFADLLSLERIERLLSSRELRFPDVQLTRSGTPVAPADYADEANRILPRRLVDHHRDGATIVLSRAHDLFPALAALVRELQTELGWPCQTNVYLSPPGNRGFGSHYDTHDVFVLQVEGRKTFRFYAGGVELPFSDERYDPESTGERVPGETIALGPGDTLYIPRGVLHDAIAEEGSPSLHVTLGVFPVVLRDVLREAVQVAAERALELRRSVPRAGGATIGADRLATRLRALAATALEDGVIEEALARLGDDVAMDTLPDCAGALREADDGRAVGDETALVVRAGIGAAASRRGTTLALRLPGEIIELEEPMATAVERLLVVGRGTPASLSGLDGTTRLALARRLLAHGVVDVATP